MILFLLQPFQSHYYPTFEMAHEFKDRGENVVYATVPFLNDLVINEGFEFYEFQYLSEYLIKNYKTFLGFFLKSIISKDFYETRKEEFEEAYKSTQLLLEKIRPTEIYLDQSLAEYYFFIKPFVDKITIVHTKFYSGKVIGIPPMNSNFIPRKKYYSFWVIEFLWLKLLTKQRLNELFLKMAFLGKDEAYFWKRYCKKVGIDWQSQIDFKHALNRGIKNVETVILAPSELEFSTFRAPISLTYFSKTNRKDESKYFSKEYLAFKKEYITENKHAIIYLAFGTLARDMKVESFFNDVIAIVARLKKTLLIVSKGNSHIQLVSANNVHQFNYVPQQDVLTYTDLFITHGGLGSVKEAYYANVPMLVVPLNRNVDQPGNAARVKAYGLGNRLNLNRYSKKDLERKIKTLLYKRVTSTRQEAKPTKERRVQFL